MKILFICSANKDRSRTAEDHFAQQFPKYQFESAGTNKKTCQQLGTNLLVEKQLQLADNVFVMETRHHQAIQKRFGGTYFRKINILHIKDHYIYGHATLKEILHTKVIF